MISTVRGFENFFGPSFWLNACFVCTSQSNNPKVVKKRSKKYDKERDVKNIFLHKKTNIFDCEIGAFEEAEKTDNRNTIQANRNEIKSILLERENNLMMLDDFLTQDALYEFILKKTINPKTILPVYFFD